MPKNLLGNIKGPPGANGKSAYEIAVEHGFSGTEEQWLLSLQAGGSLIDPVTSLPPENVLAAWSEAILTPHEQSSTPHSAYDNLTPVTAYRLGKI